MLKTSLLTRLPFRRATSYATQRYSSRLCQEHNFSSRNVSATKSFTKSFSTSIRQNKNTNVNNKSEILSKFSKNTDDFDDFLEKEDDENTTTVSAMGAKHVGSYAKDTEKTPEDEDEVPSILGMVDSDKRLKREHDVETFGLRSLTYFMTGKKDGKIEDYIPLTHEDYAKELKYLLPERHQSNFHQTKVEPRRTQQTVSFLNSLAVFTGRPAFFEAIAELEMAYEKMKAIDIDSVPPLSLEVKRYYWMPKENIAVAVGGTVATKQYLEMMKILREMVKDPRHLPFLPLIKTYMRKPPELVEDKQVHFYNINNEMVAEGRRKEAHAKVWVKTDGTGQITINGRTLPEAFPCLSDRVPILDPLIASQTLGKYDIRATTKGGGPSGQSEALRLAIAKACFYIDPSIEKYLRKYSYLRRDPRFKERKKAGKHGARRGKQWVKR